MNRYAVYYLPSAGRDMDDLPLSIYDRCRKAFLKLQDDPRPPGSKKLVGSDGYRVRVGEYRLLYRIDDAAKKIYLYRVKHRREVYR